MFNITKNKKCNIKINDKAEFECVEKGSYIPKSKIKELVKQLEQDDKNITKKYKEGKGINCYLSDVDRVRIRAYRTKTREIKERLEKLLESEE